MGIGIASALDVNIFSDISEPMGLKKGQNELVYENLQIKLAPGNYALTFNLLYNGKSIQYFEKIINFEVLEINAEGETYALRSGVGFIITKGTYINK